MTVPFLSELQSFYKRRIEIPVDSNALVLDIGSGDKPHWRADVLLDEYIEETYGSQRSGNKKVTISKPLVVANVEKMPFKDKSFDYVFCSHLLEHVQYPQKAIDEMVRVGKAGYIEVPYEGCTKIIDFPSHLWYCRQEGKKIIFTAKKSIVFDKIIDKFITNQNINEAFQAIGRKYFDHYIVSFPWKGSVSYKVNGKANMNILKQIDEENIRHNNAMYTVRNIVSIVFSYVFFYKKRRQPVSLSDILECAKCRGNIKKVKNKFICISCGSKILVVGN